MTIVLGIDPGLNNTGWGIINYQNNSFQYINSGTIINHYKTETPIKLNNIYNKLVQTIIENNPIECAIEDTFVNRNPRLSLKLGYSKAIAILAATQNNLKIFEYTPRAIKKGFTGSGKADKEQMIGMLKYLIPTHQASTEHEADALALAICHINTELSNKILNQM